MSTEGQTLDHVSNFMKIDTGKLEQNKEFWSMFNEKENVKVEDFQHSPTHKLMRDANKTTVYCSSCGRAWVYQIDLCELQGWEETGRRMGSAKWYIEKLGKENERNWEVDGRIQRKKKITEWETMKEKNKGDMDAGKFMGAC